MSYEIPTMGSPLLSLLMLFLTSFLLDDPIMIIILSFGFNISELLLTVINVIII